MAMAAQQPPRLRLPVVMVSMGVLVLVLAAGMGVRGEVIQDRLEEGQARKLHFVSKFCYSTSGVGSLRIRTWNVANDTDLKLLFFDDDLWSEVRHSGLTCQQIRDKVNGIEAGQAALREGTNLTFNIAARSRPRYWYAAFSRCAPGTMRFDYEITLRNDGDWWMQQFSVDRQGLLIVFLIFFVLYLLINLGNFFYLYTRPATSLFKLFAFMSLIEGFAMFCFLVHFALFADDGMGIPSLVGLGEILDLVVVLGLMGILVLVSRGWGLTSNKLSNFSTNVFIALMLFFCLYLAFFLWGDLDIDAVSTNTSWESAPGIINLILRAAVCVFFLLGIAFVMFGKDDRVDRSDEIESPLTPSHEELRTDEESDDEEQLLRRSRRNVAREDDVIHDRSTHEESASTPSSSADTTESSPPFDPQQAALALARKRFFLGLAIVGAAWYLSVPLAVVLSEALPPYYRLKAVLAVSYTVNFLLITLCLLWLYPERNGLHLVGGGGVFLDLSWPTFAGRGTEWQEIPEPLLSGSTTTREYTPRSVDSSSASSIPATSIPPPSSTSVRTPIVSAPTGRETTGNAQTLYDSL